MSYRQARATKQILLKKGDNPSSSGVWSYYYNSRIIYMAITKQYLYEVFEIYNYNNDGVFYGGMQ